MIEYLKKWLEEQKERFEDLMSNDSDSYSQGMCVGGKLVCADALELIEELEKVGDPAEEEKFFAKIFPKEDNDPIS